MPRTFAVGGGGGKPGGLNTYVQFNSSGNFGGDSGLVYDATNNRLSINGAASTQSLNIDGNISMTAAEWNIGASNTTSSGGIAVGYTVKATAANATSFGNFSYAQAAQACSLGYNAQANGTDSTALARASRATGATDLAVGYDVQATGGNGVCLGAQNVNAAANTVVIGAGCNATAFGNAGVIIGYSGSLTGSGGVVIGFTNTVNSSYGIAIGSNATVAVGHDYSIAMGESAATTAANQLMIGSSIIQLATIIYGGSLTLGTAGSYGGSLAIKGATSGTATIVVPTAAGTPTLTLPTTTDTLVGKATTDIFTNKTFDTAGTGNVFKINGTQIMAVTGSGTTVVMAGSPTITTPTIASFTNATHDHTNAAGGGLLSAGVTLIKASDETVQSNATVFNDAALKFSVSSNTKYWYEYFVHFNTNATPDFKYTFNVTTATITAASYVSRYRNNGTTWGDDFQTGLGTETAITGASTTDGVIWGRGYVLTSGTAGTFAFQWAQNASNATNTTVKAGSWIKYGITA